MLIERVFISRNSTNCYIVGDKNNNAAIIDPGAQAEKIYDKCNELQVNINIIINTHCHFDHIGGNEFLKKKTGAEIIVHYKERDFLTDPDKNLSSLMGIEIKSPPADKTVQDKDKIKIGSNEFEVIHTPGHSPGGISLYNKNENLLFSGDTIFQMGIGRADFPSSDRKTLIKTISNKLLTLPDNTVVYPGHGGDTTIGEFKKIWQRIKS